MKGGRTLLFEGILLTSSLHIQGERSTAAIYHLLTGRKSIQTVQDAHIYRLENFYGIYKTLSKKDYNQKVLDLTNAQQIRQHPNNDTAGFIVTPTGKLWLNQHKNNLPFAYFNGLKYADTATIFFDRLILLIQTLTNSKKQHYTFIPVIDKTSIEKWVKIVYKKSKGSESRFLTMLHKELHVLLDHFPNPEASIFVDRLSGYQQYGMSIEQLAFAYKYERHDMLLLLTGIVQSILSIIESDKNNFVFLSYILKDLTPDLPLTHSASATFKLLKKSYTIEQIAYIRKLKVNTIYDHLVEIAFYDKAFPIHRYVTKEAQQEIIVAIQRTESSKLKQIKQQISEDINYFQIRLVLAMENKVL